MVVYFSGTGNSRYCAQWLADGLDDAELDVFHFIRDGIAAELYSEKPWVFVCPTYAWQLPRIFSSFIRSGSFTGSGEAYFVMTCGSETGNAAAGVAKLCGEKDFRFRGLLQVVMPENYIALFDAPGPEEARQIVEAAGPVLADGVRFIRAGQDLPTPQPGFADRLRSGPVNCLFQCFVIRDRAFSAGEACVGCGKCARNCIMGNIHLEDDRPVWGGRCIHCMACICSCPTAAIEYGRASRERFRWQGPEYRR